MLIIKEVEYAVMILDELYHESPLSAAALSTRRNIPSPFIYRVLKKLEARDILEIRRGPKGGYSLKADCEKLTECLKSDYECVHNNDFNCRMHRQFA